MPHRLSLASFLLLSSDDEDDEDSPFNSLHSTPRSSFFLYPDLLDSRYTDDLPRRPHSLASFDSGYFSTMGKESPSKSFFRKPSRPDLHNAISATQASPKREGMMRSLLRKRKKSTTLSSSLSLDPLDATGLPYSIPVGEPVPQTQPVSLALPPPRLKSRVSSVETFERQDRFVLRRRMKYHPYSRDDAPYMLAYDRILLDNDRFSEILLRRLNPNCSPSFHDFIQGPPKTILDLGCGPGGWAVEAAEFWPSSQVIGFDLVDTASLRGRAESPSNVQWKQGNFVKYKLPFPKNMFDLVRLANLSLCIPSERWEHVLSEAKRVLAQGGHLELVDDFLYFPYSKRPSPDSHSIARVRPSSSSFDDYDDDMTGKGTDAERTNGYDADDDDDDDEDDDDFVSTKSRFSSLVDEDDVFPPPAYDPLAEWNRNVENAKSLEKLFEDMLSRKFSVHPRPSEFFADAIDKVFGRYNQCRPHEFNLYLAPAANHDSDDSSVGSSETHNSPGLKRAGKDFAKWVTTVEWDHHKEKDRKQHTKDDHSSGESLSRFSVIPDVVNAKAAGRLGIKPTTQPSHLHAAQSPGLILWPATFIPMSPFELEMHACKHLHSLIGCKDALTEYLDEIARERQMPFDEQMVDDLVWDYESFRRKRFNWPSECPDSHLEEDPVAITTTPRSHTFRNSAEAQRQASPRTGGGSMSAPPDPLFPREKLDFVRCIRVYGATKLDEESHVL